MRQRPLEGEGGLIGKAHRVGGIGGAGPFMGCGGNSGTRSAVR